jgi:hypothetical protein
MAEEERGPNGGSWVDDMVLGRGGEGRADDVVPVCFDVEEERGAGVEAHMEDAEEGMWGRRMHRTRRRSGSR